MPGPGADADGADLDILHLLRLRYRDGEPLGRADAVGDALDEVGQGLGLLELDQAAHARFLEPLDALDGVDDAARVTRRRGRKIRLFELGGFGVGWFGVGALAWAH